jgi:hypothetical protein
MKLPLKTDSYGLNWIGAILAALVTQRKPFDHQQAAALAAAAESELVTAGKRHCQKYCVLERDLRRGNRHPVRFECITESFTAGHSWQ